MRVLITGASGFVGRHLSQAVLARGWEVLAVGRAQTRPATVPAAANWLCVPEYSALQASVLHGVDVIVHLAALVHQMRQRPDAAEYDHANLSCTEAVAGTAAAAGVGKFIFMSTIKVYGESSERAYDHSSIPAPADAYARSKYKAEQMLRSQLEPERLSIIRPPLVYGPYVRANFLSLLEWARRGVPLPIAGIDNQRSLIYVENLVDAICQIASSRACAPEGLPIADVPAISTGELYRYLLTAMGRSNRSFGVPYGVLKFGAGLLGQSDRFERLSSSLSVDPSAFQERFGWKAPISLRDGIARTSAWYLDEKAKDSS